MKLYNVAYSGNSYKVRLLLAQLGLVCEIIEVDILKGESRTPEFLKINPNGRTPVLDDDGFVLAESNAILGYLARGTKFLPEHRQRWAQVFQWLFFEQYSHEPYIAVARFFEIHPEHQDDRRAGLPRIMKNGYDALGVMESHLSGAGEGDHPRDYFVGGKYSIADIALYAYTHVAHEGGFDLSNYPAIQSWLARVKSQPRHIPITQA